MGVHLMKNLILASTFLGLFILPGAALADHYHRRPSTHHYRPGGSGYWYQHKRPNYGNYGGSHFWGNRRSPYGGPVAYGVRSGQLTSRELNDIREREREIQRSRYRYGSDGYFSFRERQSLNNQIRDLRENIQHNLHDGERRTYR